MKRLSWIAIALAAGHLIVAIALTFSPNPGGAAGGIAYAGMYAAPAFLVGLGLRAQSLAWLRVTGWAAGALGVLYFGLVALNWPGYSPPEAMFAVAVNLPTGLVDVAAFLVVILSSRHWRRPVSGPS
ncbi:MAG TPA: hypothetical protein VFL29_01445 [Candidatus Dormibacteraeota bacterium]|nr:hypothetical protein [Candidatus Dormibacteraeota bacterium]